MSRKRVSSVRRPPVVRPPPTDGGPKNRLLAALPAGKFRPLAPHLTTVSIRTKQGPQKQVNRFDRFVSSMAGVASITTHPVGLHDGRLSAGRRSTVIGVR